MKKHYMLFHPPPKAYLGIKSERHYEPTRYVLYRGLSRSIPYPHLTRGQQDLRDDGPDPSNWPDRIDPFWWIRLKPKILRIHRIHSPHDFFPFPLFSLFFFLWTFQNKVSTLRLPLDFILLLPSSSCFTLFFLLLFLFSLSFFSLFFRRSFSCLLSLCMSALLLRLPHKFPLNGSLVTHYHHPHIPLPTRFLSYLPQMTFIWCPSKSPNLAEDSGPSEIYSALLPRRPPLLPLPPAAACPFWSVEVGIFSRTSNIPQFPHHSSTLLTIPFAWNRVRITGPGGKILTPPRSPTRRSHFHLHLSSTATTKNKQKHYKKNKFTQLRLVPQQQTSCRPIQQSIADPHELSVAFRPGYDDRPGRYLTRVNRWQFWHLRMVSALSELPTLFPRPCPAQRTCPGSIDILEHSSTLSTSIKPDPQLESNFRLIIIFSRSHAPRTTSSFINPLYTPPRCNGNGFPRCFAWIFRWRLGKWCWPASWTRTSQLLVRRKEWWLGIC